MHVIKSQKHLLCDLLDKMRRNALSLVAFDESQQILAEDLKDHANVGTVGPFMAEVVEERNNMGSTGMRLCGRGWRMRIFWCGLDGRRRGGDQAL